MPVTRAHYLPNPFTSAVIGRANTPTNHGRPDGLTTRQIRDLSEFVLSIDGNLTAAEVRAARDTQPPRIERAEVTSLTRIEVWFSETVKAAGATNAANWQLVGLQGAPAAITAAVFDAQSGDHIILTTQLQPHRTYTLASVGPMFDDADSATGNSTNAMDPGDPANHRVLALTDRLTLTLGASGYY